MNIDKYKMTIQDEYNIKLSIDIPKKEAFGKKPKDGETSEKIIGYFGTLAGAIKKMVHLEIDSKVDTFTAEEIISSIVTLETLIESKYSSRQYVKDHIGETI